MTLQTKAIIAAALLTAYVLGMLYAILAKPRRHDPQRGMAVGCLMIVIAGVLVLGTVLAIGAFNDLYWLVQLPFLIAVFPAVMLVVTGAGHLIGAFKRR